jgi:hypothetical protein
LRLKSQPGCIRSAQKKRAYSNTGCEDPLENAIYPLDCRLWRSCVDRVELIRFGHFGDRRIELPPYSSCRSVHMGAARITVRYDDYTAKCQTQEPTDRLAVYCVQDMEMQLNKQEASLVDAFRRLPPDTATELSALAERLAELAPNHRIDRSDSWSDEDLNDFRAASLRRLDAEESEDRD